MAVSPGIATVTDIDVNGEFFAANPAFGGFPLAPNLIHNSFMNKVTGGVPDGWIVSGGPAVTIEAVDPWTKAFEGVYTDPKPAHAVDDPELATGTNPYWFGKHTKGPRIVRGGLKDGWGNYTDGKILKVSGTGVGVHCSIQPPKDQNNLGARWLFACWVKIVKGANFAVGGDAGWNRTAPNALSKATADTGPQGWYRRVLMITTSQICNIGDIKLCLAINPDVNNEIEGYIALPYLALANFKGTNLDVWTGSVLDKLSRQGVYIHPETKEVGFDTAVVRAATNRVYHEGFKPSPTDIGAAALSGATFTGTVNFNGILQSLGVFNVNGSGPGEQPDGIYQSDLGSTQGTTLQPTFTNALAWQNGNARSSAIAVDTEGYLWGFRSHSNPGTYTWKSKTKTADALTFSRSISLTGDVTGNVSFDGSANAAIAATVPGLASKANLASPTFTGTVTAPTFAGALSGNATTATTAAALSTTLPINRGGTGGTATPTAGGISYGNGSAHAFTLAGTAKQALVSNGSGAPSWATLDLTYLPDAAFKKSVKVATTANITLSGTQTIDGIAVVAGDRVLVKNQTTANQNGIYDVAAGAWARSAGANTSSEIGGAVVNVDSGTQGGVLFTTTFKTTDTLGTTSMNWFSVLDSGTGATIAGLNLKANLASPTFTGTPAAPTASAGTNTTQLATTAFVTAAANLKANLASPTFTGTPAAPTPAAGDNTTKIATTAYVRGEVSALVAAAPGTLDTLNELATALGNDPNFATSMTNALAAKAPLDSPAFTGTPTGITKSHVGLGNVDNTADADKPVSSVQSIALGLKANLASPTFTGTVTAPTFAGALTGNASTASSAAALSTTNPINRGGTNSTATPTAGGVPYGTGSAYAFTAAGSAKQVLQSNAAGAPTWATLDLTYLPDAAFKKSVRVATTANITLSGLQTIDGIAVVANDRVLVKNQTTASQNGIYIASAGAWTRAPGADTSLEIGGAVVNVDSGTQGGILWTTTFKTTDTINTTAMNWYSVLDSSTGATVAALNAKANLASPALTGTPTAPTAANGTNTTQIATTAHVLAGLNLKANLASPTFTGTPAAPTAAAGTNTTQVATTAFVTAGLGLKANLASPTLTGTPLAPTPATADNSTKIATTAFVKANDDLQASLTLGTQAAMEINRDVKAAGLYTYNVINTTTDRPPNLDYGSALNWGRGLGGSAQLLAGWTAGSANFLAFRSLRDNTDNWWPWKRIYHEGYKPTATDIGAASLVSPDFTGTPTAPTPTAGDNTTKLATTAFVAGAVAVGAPTARFHANVTASYVQIFAGWKKIAFASEASDPDGVFDPATSRFKPKELGTYRLSASVQIGSPASPPFANEGATLLTIAIFKATAGGEATEHRRGSMYYVSNNQYGVPHISTDVEVTSLTDEFEVHVFLGHSGNSTVHQDVNTTWFQGHKVTAGQQGPQGLAGTVPAVVPVGTVISTFANSIIPFGYLKLEGGTIGNAVSGATARNNADTWPLYALLWEQTAAGVQTASGGMVGRGVSAQYDFDVNKRLILPDMRGRFIRGTGGAKAAAHASLQTMQMQDHKHLESMGWDGGYMYWQQLGASTEPGHGSTVYNVNRRLTTFAHIFNGGGGDNAAARIGYTSWSNQGLLDSATETRPDNISLVWLIRYAEVDISPADVNLFAAKADHTNGTLTNPTLFTPTMTTPTMNNPILTGVTEAPTPVTTDQTTKVATTAFVRAAITAYGAGGGGAGTVAFMSQRSSGNWPDSATWPHKFESQTEEYDDNGVYDPANARITPPAGRPFRFNCKVTMTFPAAAGTLKIQLRKNGNSTPIAISPTWATVANQVEGVFEWSIDDQGNGTDYYEFWIEMTAAGTKNWIFGQRRSGIWGNTI